MDNNTFRKKLNEFGAKTCEKLDKLFEGATRTKEEFFEKFKNPKIREKAVKIAGASIVSLALLCGSTGCMADNGQIVETSSAGGFESVASSTPKKEESSSTVIIPWTSTTSSIESSPFESNKDSTPSVESTPWEPTIESTPSVESTPWEPTIESTQQSPSESTPAETTGVVTPPASPSLPVEPSSPVTTNKTPEESTPLQETQNSSPQETSPAEIESTSPQETEVETPALEDLPADEDGYKYPEYFLERITKSISKENALSDEYYYNQILNQTPEIVFVERGTSSKEEHCPIIVYAKYYVGDKGEKPLYTRFAFTIGSTNFLNLGKAKNFSSYSEYIAKIIEAMKAKSVFISAEVSEINDKQDAINAQIGETFAKFIDEKFVDAEINFARSVWPAGEVGYRVISGFAYDEEGKSYNFNLEFEEGAGLYDTVDQIILRLQNGETLNFDRVDSSFKGISDVFTKEIQNEG